MDEAHRILVCRKCLNPQIFENIPLEEGCYFCHNLNTKENGPWYVVRYLKSVRIITKSESIPLKPNWWQRILLKIVPESWINLTYQEKEMKESRE